LQRRVVKEMVTDRSFELYKWLERTSNLAFKVRGKELGQYGISAMHAAVLDTIQEIGREATPAEIARRLVREPHTISNLVIRMEKQGLVRKVNDLGRKNLVRVVMTPKGRDAYAKISKRVSTQKLMSGISDEEFQKMMQLFQKIQAKAYESLGKNNPFNKLTKRRH
jgi:DNA-binding MarR family transcriptional regulator